MRDAKQVIILRKDLNMRKGKMVAQGAHASMKVLLDLARQQVIDGLVPGVIPFRLTLDYGNDQAMAQWLEGNFKKICVSAKDEAELLEVHAAAKAQGIPCALILDSGLTEFGGVPTHTAVALGPAWSDTIDPITGHLPLL